MLIDHIGEGFVQHGTVYYDITQFIGYIAAPLFFFFIAEGYRHTSNINRYTLNLALFAAISYLPYIIYFHGSFSLENLFNFNIIFKLLLGLLILRARHEIKRTWLKVLVIILLFILSAPGDWAYTAPLAIFMFDVFYGNRNKQIFGYVLVAMIHSELFVNSFWGVFQTMFRRMFRDFAFPIEGFIGNWVYLGLFIPVALLYFYNGEKGRDSKAVKWGFYIFYPAHLILLTLIKQVV
jgi:hypothetical protein